MPNLHRGAVATLVWTLTLDAPLADPPSVAIYLNGTQPVLEWLPLAWAGEEVVANGQHTRPARLVVAGPDAGAPLPEGTHTLPRVGRYVNWVRVGSGATERVVGQGESIAVLK